MRSRLEFLASAVAEAQATIRALDVKLAALLVATLAPAPLLPSIALCFSGIYKTWSGIIVGSALIIFCGTWALAVTCFAMALGAIHNPAAHVKNEKSYSGSLFSPGLYRFAPLDAIKNRKTVISELEPSEHLQRLPSREDEIESELSFEHLKLIYIRDLKIFRLRWGYRFSALTIFLGATFYAVGRYHLSECGP